MSGQNRWNTFLLICIFKAVDTSSYRAVDTSSYRVLNSSVQGINIIHDYNLDNKIQDSETAFQINEDSLRNSRRIILAPQKYTNCDQCGIANTKRRSPRRIKIGTKEDTRIINGKTVRPRRKYPWQVGLFNKFWKNGLFFCGGTIINDRWILTAAHCFVYPACVIDYSEVDNGDIYVRVGEHKQIGKRDDDKNNTKNYKVKRLITHPRNDKYCPKHLNYDFALLELEERITFNDVIRPVCLPEDDSKKYNGEIGIVSGWGWTRLDEWSDVLMEVEFRIKRNNKCINVDVEETNICGGPIAHTGPCKGDSGGPLVVKEGKTHIQVGVVSYGSDDPGCGWKASNVFGRISTVLNWIQETTSTGDC